MALKKEELNEETYVDEKVVEAAKEEAQDASNIVTVYLKKPVQYNGEEVDKLEFDFDRVTGEDALNIERELQSIGRPAFVPVASGEYLIRMAAYACVNHKIGADIFNTMSLRDYNKVTSAARNFLLSSE
ncbi:MAG: hypothetical protein ILA17_06255 [Ruminococcus sp.]|nr:hypothetical protein [Ruminiclostridium sp.]MBP1537452.1 hypothetical protein [Ruminococcus sp.]